eukprot:scaffold20884_cov150-Skeletonema_dohrnii-CCMP3373.AAC.3
MREGGLILCRCVVRSAFGVRLFACNSQGTVLCPSPRARRVVGTFTSSVFLCVARYLNSQFAVLKRRRCDL